MQNESNLTHVKALSSSDSRPSWAPIAKKLFEVTSTAQAFTVAELDFDVSTSLLEADGRGYVDGVRGVYRCDKETAIGFITEGDVIQNVEAFKFMDGLVADGTLKVEWGGKTFNGECVFLIGLLPSLYGVNESEDVIDRCLLMSLTHHKRSQARVSFAPIRRATATTLQIVAADPWIGLSQSFWLDLCDEGGFGCAINESSMLFFSRFERQVNKLAKCVPSNSTIRELFATVIPELSDMFKYRECPDFYSEIFKLFCDGRGQHFPETRGTLWSAFDAIVEYIDYRLLLNNSSGQCDGRVYSAWFGLGNKLKEQAWRKALQLAS